MHKYHNIHNIIGCTTALVVGTQVNNAMADYGYGSLDDLKAHWRGKPNAIPETFNQLWLDNNDEYIWQDSGNFFGRRTKEHRFLIKGGYEDYSFDGKWKLNGLPEKFGGVEAVRIYKALSNERFLTSIFGIENLTKITFNQDEGCPTKIVYKPEFRERLFKDGKRIELRMSVFQKSNKGDIAAEIRFIFEKTGDIVEMAALDGTVKIGSFDENHQRTEQTGHIWMKKPHSTSGDSCGVFNSLRRLPAMYKELQKNFNACKKRVFDLWIEKIGNDGFTGEITSPTLLQITNQNFVRRKIASFLQVISSNEFFENVLGKQYWNDIQSRIGEEELGIPDEDRLWVLGKIRWSADGVKFSENVVPNPVALSVQLEIKETEVVSKNPNGVSIETNPILYRGGKEHYRNKICFRFVYDVQTDTIRDAGLCPGKLISGDQVQLKVSGQGIVPTLAQQAQPRHVRQTVEHDFSGVDDFPDLFKFDASK